MHIDMIANKYIPISKEVKEKLISMKSVPRESYDDVLRRMLKMQRRMIINE